MLLSNYFLVHKEVGYKDTTQLTNSPVENQNDLELDFKVFFFADSCCSDIVLEESN